MPTPTPPSKALIPATAYSTAATVTHISNKLSVSQTVYSAPPSAWAALWRGTPMFFNPFGIRFAFRLLYTTNLNPGTRYIRTNQRTINLSSFSTKAIYMLANTFPAVYTTTVVRPIYGQIWPRSGFLPPF
ncbi:MAG: hypothetical protein JHC33_10235 [Ignisphaera sp.]|nr:hypothetical protein [Ignisphaera sp.]